MGNSYRVIIPMDTISDLGWKKETYWGKRITWLSEKKNNLIKIIERFKLEYIHNSYVYRVTMNVMAISASDLRLACGNHCRTRWSATFHKIRGAQPEWYLSP